VAAAVGLLVAPAFAQAPTTAKATFIDQAGKEVGTATLTQTPGGVLIRAEISGVPAGEHAFHIHEAGVCDPATKFNSAKGHYSGGHQHGYLVAAGPHIGDMPNQFAPGDGPLRVEVFNPMVALDAGERGLFDADGSALVVHAGKDDYSSQPSGAAGDRIACAVIERP
jgi:Cu-Zn family superoxide dismutase